jgi:hypothetical protein
MVTPIRIELPTSQISCACTSEHSYDYTTQPFRSIKPTSINTVVAWPAQIRCRQTPTLDLGIVNKQPIPFFNHHHLPQCPPTANALSVLPLDGDDAQRHHHPHGFSLVPSRVSQNVPSPPTPYHSDSRCHVVDGDMATKPD